MHRFTFYPPFIALLSVIIFSATLFETREARQTKTSISNNDVNQVRYYSSYDPSVACPLNLQNFMGEDRRANRDKLKIATFNAHWLFDGIDDNPEMVPWRSPKHAEEHYANIAAVLRHMNADIVNMVEVESCAVLSAVNAIIPEMNYKPFILQGTDTATRQNVALLTRVDPITPLMRTDDREYYPIEGSSCGYRPAYQKRTGVSKHFYTNFEIELPSSTDDPKFSLTLVSLHLKAIPNEPQPCAQREAQASVIHRLIKNITLEEPDPHSAVVVLGDFNDYDADLHDFSGSEPRSRSLRLLKESRNLVNVASLMDRTKTSLYSNWYDRNNNGVIDHRERELSLIDHILVSPHTTHAISNAYIVQDLYPTGNNNFSDHWPIVFEYDLRKLTAVGTTPSRHGAVNIIVVVLGVGFLVGFTIVFLVMVAKEIRQRRRAFSTPLDRRHLGDAD